MIVVILHRFPFDYIRDKAQTTRSYKEQGTPCKCVSESVGGNCGPYFFLLDFFDNLRISQQQV
jgi:hypothetical protein